MNKELPSEYIPSVLRETPRKEMPVRFAIGKSDRNGGGGYGMTNGPFDTLQEALEIVGEEGSLLFFLDGEFDGPIYRWFNLSQKWRLLKCPEKVQSKLISLL